MTRYWSYIILIINSEFYDNGFDYLVTFSVHVRKIQNSYKTKISITML